MTGVRRHRWPNNAEPRGDTIRVPIHFDPDVFELLRKRAERERSSIGVVVNEFVERGLGG